MKSYILLISLFIFSCDLSVEPPIEDPEDDNNGLDEVNISIGILNPDENTLAINLSNNVEIAGFQFDMYGIVITGANGGLAEDNGLSVSTSENRVLGFSLSGNVIPISEGILLYLNYNTIIAENICLENVIFSGLNGQELTINIIGECN